ncbi:DinB family protein [Streptomyces sp. NPDC017979]|uniref:DinB family protein n=1 Tax=Streptomyces sp. NPDC017979 TaxID=3365024 RepID=UPI0037B0AA16
MTTMPDGRPIAPPQADERTMLDTWLDYHRGTIALKCEGLTDEQLRLTSVEPSSMSLLGLVQHLAEVERNWFRRKFEGQDVPPVFTDFGDDGFGLHPDRGLDEAMAAWQAEIAHGRAITADASLDDCGHLSDEEAAFVGGKEISLRWILVHLVEEYARHAGHADLLRERIDGVTGP